MAGKLAVRFGGFSDAGVKARNDDAFAAKLPDSASLRATKGAVAAIADGISVSDRSHLASQLSVTQFIEDYLSTPEGWDAETSASRVLRALNDWLHSQSRHNQTSAMVTTFSAAVVKSRTLHIFHIGDSRIYLFRDGKLTQLTRDHSMEFTRGNAVLTAAIGMDARLAVDYSKTQIEPKDVILLSTDGVTNALPISVLEKQLADSLKSKNLDFGAEAICAAALDAGANDNVTIGLMVVDSLPQGEMRETQRDLGELPVPPVMQVGNRLDSYRVLKIIHSGTRSHIYQVECENTGQIFGLKTLSPSLANDSLARELFSREQWIGRRLDHPGLMRVETPTPNSKFSYMVFEFVRGQTLRDWMVDHPKPSLSEVRELTAAISVPLRAMHRMGMVHADLKPENIMITHEGCVKIIDFGLTQVAGMSDVDGAEIGQAGAVHYAAPECVLGTRATPRSDLFSLAVMTYEMLAGQKPFRSRGRVSQPTSASDWNYIPFGETRTDIPFWVGHALERACVVVPENRTPVLSEFIEALNRPSPEARRRETSSALLERNPVAFWRGLSVGLLVVILILIGLLSQFAVT